MFDEVIEVIESFHGNVHEKKQKSQTLIVLKSNLSGNVPYPDSDQFDNFNVFFYWTCSRCSCLWVSWVVGSQCFTSCVADQCNDFWSCHHERLTGHTFVPWAGAGPHASLSRSAGRQQHIYWQFQRGHCLWMFVTHFNTCLEIPMDSYGISVVGLSPIAGEMWLQDQGL